jgi:hypothetical protein
MDWFVHPYYLTLVFMLNQSVCIIVNSLLVPNIQYIPYMYEQPI